MADATLEAVITANVTGFDKGVRGVMSDLNGLRGAFMSLSGVAFLSKAIQETIQAEGAVAQLDAAMKSTSGSIGKATTQAGHWATVTKKSGDHVKEWEKSLKAAQGSMERLSAKQAAGIPLTQAEHKAYAAASAAANQYAGALAGASTTKKVWIEGELKSIGVSHMSREAMLGMADSLSKVTRFSDETVVRSQAMLLTFTKIGKDVFPEATEAVLDMSEAMGQDWKSSAVQIGKALNDPIEGLTALRRVGVTFSAEQEKMIKGLVKSGKLMEAQKLILKELKTEFGGSAKAAGETLGGALDILGNRVSNLMEGIGGALSPVLKGLAGVAGQAIDAMGPFAPLLAAIGVGMTAAGIASLPFAASLLAIAAPIAVVVAGVGALALAFDRDFMGIKTSVMSVVGPIGSAITEIKGKIDGFLKDVFGGEERKAPLSDFAAVEGPGAFKGGQEVQKGPDLGQRLAKALGIDPKIFADIQKTIDDTLKPIGAGIKGFIDNLSGADMSGVETVLKGLIIAVGALASGIAAIGLGTLKGIGEALPSLGSAIKNFIDMLAAASKGDISGALGNLGNGIIKIAEGLIRIPMGAAEELGKLLGIDIKGGLAAWQGVADNLGTIVNTVVGNVRSAFEGLKADIETGLMAANEWLMTTGQGLFKTAFGALADIAKSAFGGIGGALVAGVASGLRKILAALTALNVAGVPGVQGLEAAVRGALQGMEGQATGGPVSAGQSYVVGERGMEVFRPTSSGAIIPNHELGRGGGGGNISIQNLTIYGVNNPQEMYAQIQSEAKRRNRPLAGAM